MNMISRSFDSLMEAYERVISRPNPVDEHFYNGIFNRYRHPVLTREHIPPFWMYDANPESNPFMMQRLGVNATLNSGAIKLDGKYCLVVRVEGMDRKSFFAVAESSRPTEGFRFRDYPVILPDTEAQETNVYDMRLTQHEDGWIYGVFCSESKDTTVSDLSAATAAAGIVRTKDLTHWERLPNLRTLHSPQQRNVASGLPAAGDPAAELTACLHQSLPRHERELGVIAEIKPGLRELLSGMEHKLTQICIQLCALRLHCGPLLFLKIMTELYIMSMIFYHPIVHASIIPR